MIEVRWHGRGGQGCWTAARLLGLAAVKFEGKFALAFPSFGPEHIHDYPVGPGMDAGHLVAGNAGWRTFRPVIDMGSCTGCYRCYLVCPDGVIFKKNDKVDIDLDFCKGCGVCSYECPANAIGMIKEAEE